MSESKTNALELTVSELSGKLKRTVEETFGHVRVRGEISGFRGPHSSGHCYFSIKDEKARLEAVIWRGVASKLKFLPEEGLEMIASGKLTTYPGSSKYQIVIDNLEPAGAGALMVLLEERRKKLAAEGLFDEGRKQLLPYMPRIIGVVTSPTGAVIRDILHRLSDRFPLHVLVWPVRVQGESSGAEVANGIRQFNAMQEGSPLPRPDLIIVARGGGSLEDLWGFNDEILVRAAADSMIPLISAVGHETDWTLIDHVADWRAPTPTAAAEKAVPVKAELEAQIADFAMRLRRAQVRNFEKNRSELRGLARALPSPDTLLALPRRRLDEASGRLSRGLVVSSQQARSRFERLHLRPRYLLQRIGQERIKIAEQSSRLRRAMVVKTERWKSQLERSSRLLKSLSYHGVLERGFAVIKDANEKPVMGISGLKDGVAILIEMHDGKKAAHIGGGGTDKPIKAKKTARRSKKSNEDQGSLF
jgi:exodeoxyribonuclease VII large subunit